MNSATLDPKIALVPPKSRKPEDPVAVIVKAVAKAAMRKPRKKRDPATINMTGLRPAAKGHIIPPARPDRKPLSKAYKELLHQVFVDPATGIADPNGRTWAQVIALGQAKAAASGYTPAAREIADRTEGTVLQGVRFSSGAIPVSALADEDLDKVILTNELPSGAAALLSGSKEEGGEI